MTSNLLFDEWTSVFGSERLTGVLLDRLLPVGSVRLVQIAFDTLLDLRHAPLHLGAREVPVPVVDRLELGAINRHAGFGEQVN